MADPSKRSAYGAPAGDTDFRKTWDLDEYAAKGREREARLAGRRYHRPATGEETLTAARRHVLDLGAQLGKTQLVPARAGVGRRGRGAGFYCAACDLTLKDNKQYVEHLNTAQHLASTGQTAAVRRATAGEVRARVDALAARRAERDRERAAGLGERLRLRADDAARDAEDRRRRRRRADADRRRQRREGAARDAAAYGDDVRVDGEHDDDDMRAQLGFTGFATSKQP